MDEGDAERGGRGDITDDLIIRSTKQRPNRTEDFEHFLNRLTHLNMQKRGVRRICNLHGCGRLRTLYLYDNRIARIENLAFARTLTHLYLQNNRIERMEGMECLSSLTKLFLDGNRIAHVEGLEGCTRLEELHVSNQDVPDGTNLSFDAASMASIAGSLTVLNVSSTRLESLAPIGDLERLVTLKAADNHVADFSEVGAVLMACLGLHEIDLRRNPIAEAPGYRDAVIINSEVLNEIDGKPVKPNQRDFLRSREARRYSQRRLQERRASAKAATEVIEGEVKENTRQPRQQRPLQAETRKGPRGSFIKAKARARTSARPGQPNGEDLGIGHGL